MSYKYKPRICSKCGAEIEKYKHHRTMCLKCNLDIAAIGIAEIALFLGSCDVAE